MCANTHAISKGKHDPDIQTFLKLVRYPQVQASWATLEGMLRLKKSGEKKVKVPIELRAAINHERISAQLIFNKKERYRIHQKFIGEAESTTITLERQQDVGKLSLTDTGLKPGDLTLSFLYWDFDSELKMDRVRGQRCRVVKLTRPGHDEYVIIWISRKYHFPLTVKWFFKDADDPYRTLEFTGFEKTNTVWIIKELKISMPNQKSIVKFTNSTVHLVDSGKPIPDDLFVAPHPANFFDEKQ